MAAVRRRSEGGAPAKLLVAPAASVVPVPDGATLAQASTLPSCIEHLTKPKSYGARASLIEEEFQAQKAKSSAPRPKGRKRGVPSPRFAT